MNVAMRMTMGGLTRALRGFAHDLAGELELQGQAMVGGAARDGAGREIEGRFTRSGRASRGRPTLDASGSAARETTP